VTDDSEAKRLVDPQGLYPSEGLTGCEHRCLDVLEAVREAGLHAAAPTRTRDVFQLDVPVDGGEDLDFVSLVVTEEALEARLPAIEWTTGYAGPTVVTTLWRRERFSRLRGRALGRFLAQAVGAHRARFVTCPRCKQRFGPGQTSELDGQAVCHGCAERFHGVVY
jgi:hypothetical protein